MIGYLWFVMFTMTFATGVIYLALLELIPVSLSSRLRRVIAIALSPIVGGGIWLYALSLEPGRVAGAILVATIVYGIVVRLQSPARPRIPDH